VSKVTGAMTHIHFHDNGKAVLQAAKARERNTTLVIGGDVKNGVLLLDIDVQDDTCSGVAELREQLLMIIEALEGYDPNDERGTQ